ncbi:MAG: ribonuclease HII [Betaproteobacteria bacterium]|nr:ribonuclease HII [Betaproteobacteria bacterium]
MNLVCGIDEAGRGPLAGPVYAAAVILDAGLRLDGLADSKRLGPQRRAELSDEIKACAVAWAVGNATVEEIDEINILQASLLAMTRAVNGLAIAPREALVDGTHRPRLPMPVHAIVRGDQTVAAIQAASILAKVARDAEMVSLHRLHPQYGFDRHKGYPTLAHLAALRKYGVSCVHRRTFAPVRALLEVESQA